MSFEMSPYFAVVILLASIITSLWLMRWRPSPSRPWIYYMGQGVQATLMLALLTAIATDLPRELTAQTGPGFVDERTERLMVIIYFTIGLAVLAMYKSITNVVEFVREQSQANTAGASQ